MTDTIRFEIYTPSGTVVVDASPAWKPVQWSDALTEEKAWAAMREFQAEYGEAMSDAPVVEVTR